MSRASFEKIKPLLLDAAGGLFFVLFVYKLVVCFWWELSGANVILALIFLLLAVKCIYGRICCLQLARLRNNEAGKEEIEVAKERQDYIDIIITRAAAAFYMLLLAVVFLCSRKMDLTLAGLLGAALVLFVVEVFRNVRDLRRFDKENEKVVPLLRKKLNRE